MIFKSFPDWIKDRWQKFKGKIVSIARFLTKFLIDVFNLKDNFVFSLFVVVTLSLGIIFLSEFIVTTIQWNSCQLEQQITQPQSGQKTEQQTTQPQSEQKADYFISCKDAKDKEFARDTYLGYLLQKIVYFTTQTSIILMFIIFAYFTGIAYKRYRADSKNTTGLQKDQKEKQRELEEKGISRFLTEVLVASLSISAIPTGISLMICAFYDIKFIKHMSGVEIYVAFAGISILSIGFLSTLQERVQISDKGEINDPADFNPANSPSEESDLINDLMRKD